MRLCKILEKLTDVELFSLEDPQYLLVPKNRINELIGEYNEFKNINEDSYDEHLNSGYALKEDLESFIGLKIVEIESNLNEFKILTEIIPYSK